jgi:AraC-like DNA-binding protein
LAALIKYQGIMARRAENSIIYHSLHESPLVSVRSYCCHAERSGPGAEEFSGTNTIVLLRRGAFCQHFGRRTVTADVNQTVFFAQDSTYRVSHPAECGDRGTVFDVAPRVLNDIIGGLQPSHANPDRPFPFSTGPCDLGAFWQHYELVEGLQTNPVAPPEPLWAEETALRLIGRVLETAFAHHGLPARPRRTGTEAAHAERVEAVKSYLARRQGERMTLGEVARAVHTSPYHLARVFRQRTGLSLHRYLTRLRLRAALERLAAGANDLTTLALELGYCSHSHFTDAFRREFGRPPSAVRRHADGKGLREMSKNLEV